ncbi:MAG: prepilin-type N-terminal cleavage/methylation domain-containing protein [Planctomycetota bacterium]
MTTLAPAAPATRSAAAPRSAARRGFNLIEVMVSMGIFVVAFVAVASIFPVAFTLQREAVQTVDDNAALASAEAAMLAFGVDVTNDDSLSTIYAPPVTGGGGSADCTVQPMLDEETPAPGSLNLSFESLQSRSIGVNPLSPDDPIERPYVWVPLVRPTILPADLVNPRTVDDYEVFIAILRRNELGSDQRYADRLKEYADGWATHDDDQAPNLATGPIDQQERLYRVPSLRRLELIASDPTYDANANETTFGIGGPDGNEDGFGNRLIMPFDIFMDDNGFRYQAIASTLNSVTVFGVVEGNEQTGARANFLWYAPRPLEDGSNSRRPEDAPSPLIAIEDISEVLK